jgi:hypothetical protein
MRKALIVWERSFDPNPQAVRPMFKMSEVVMDMGRMGNAASARVEAGRLKSMIKTFIAAHVSPHVSLVKSLTTWFHYFSS